MPVLILVETIAAFAGPCDIPDLLTLVAFWSFLLCAVVNVAAVLLLLKGELTLLHLP